MKLKLTDETLLAILPIYLCSATQYLFLSFATSWLIPWSLIPTILLKNTSNSLIPWSINFQFWTRQPLYLPFLLFLMLNIISTMFILYQGKWCLQKEQHLPNFSKLAKMVSFMLWVFTTIKNKNFKRFSH